MKERNIINKQYFVCLFTKFMKFCFVGLSLQLFVSKFDMVRLQESEEPLNLEALEKIIQRSQPKTIEIGWYQNEGFVQHSGLVIIFDGVVM